MHPVYITASLENSRSRPDKNVIFHHYLPLLQPVYVS